MIILTDRYRINQKVYKMKCLLYSVLVCISFAACNSRQRETRDVLVSSFEGKYKCNTIIVLKKNADNIQYVSAYTLKNNLYSTFCINDQNECLAVCSKNSSIEVYKLPKVK